MDGLKARLSFDAVAYDYDDEYLTIDTDTHTININNVSRLFGVQYDGNSKLIKFRVRNKLSDIQKMQDSIVYINWIDSRGVKGQSIAINKTINNDTCEFAWKVPFNALKNSGVLHFAMSAVVTKNSSSVIDQRWSTKIASVIKPDGIYIKSYTPSSEEEDRIAQIYNELSNMINKQNDNLSDMQSQVNLLKEDLDAQNSGIGVDFEIKNLFDYTKITINKIVDDLNDVAIQDYYVSDFIEVEPSTFYCIPYTGSVIGTGYNSELVRVTKFKRSDYEQKSSKYSIFKTNASTKYVRINGYNGKENSSFAISPSKYMLIKGQEYPNVYIPFKKMPLSNLCYQSNILYGKTLLTYGDSITEGINASTDSDTSFKKTYAGYVAIRNNMNFVNLGWSGATMADDNQKPFIHNGKIYEHFDNKLITPDYITVWFGWNDYAHFIDGTGITLGKLGDTDESTFYGAYAKACELLINKFPKARIGLIVQYGTDEQWRNAVKNIANKYGLPYLDLYNNFQCIYNNEFGVEENIANLRKETFLADGTHLKAFVKGVRGYFSYYLRRFSLCFCLNNAFQPVLRSQTATMVKKHFDFIICFALLNHKNSIRFVFLRMVILGG